jgi:subtilase family serine protease
LQQASEIQMRRLVSVLGVVGILLGATAPAVAGVTVGASRLTHSVVDVCGPATPGTARCHAKLVVYGNGIQSGLQPFAGTPSGLNPTDLWSAYNLPQGTAAAWNWNKMTVAIVDAYDDPKAESDLAVYRSQFPGLPACTTSNGCFRKVNQSGGTRYPRGNAGWAEEISLDLDMVSAICPNCKILLVEATSATFSNLSAAEDTAAKLGANAISNSYGGSEWSTETSYDSHYNHPGVAITVSSGDSGYGVQYPAASPYVTAVGGTSLKRDSTTTRRWSETAWSGAGSGCSAFETKPSWQTDAGCLKRTVADVSADADPYTGVSVYDTYGGVGGWLVFGGTSVASPIIASVYALAGNASSVDYGSYPYVHGTSTTLNDVISGSNGSCGTSSSSTYYLCNAISGYDGPTGLGTPNGTGGF